MYLALQTHTHLKAHTIHWKLLHAEGFQYLLSHFSITFIHFCVLSLLATEKSPVGR